MEIVRLRQADPYEPGGHHGVVNRLLAGRGSGGVEAVSVWHGALSPGGGADVHVHEHSVQIYYVLTGVVEVSTGSAEPVGLEPADVAIVSAGEPHDIHNRSDTEAQVLVISAPALR